MSLPLKRKQRLASHNAVTRISPTEEGSHQPSAQCATCARSVFDSVRIRCAECDDVVRAFPGNQFSAAPLTHAPPAAAQEVCVECFSVGAETGAHKAWHAYRVVDSLAFPFLTLEWSAEEELALLEALEAFGLGRWTEVAEHVGTKSRSACHEHYTQRYLRSPTAPLPDLGAVIGKEGAAALAAARAGADATAPALSGAAAAALERAAASAAEEGAKAAALASFAKPGGPRFEGNAPEVTGFNAKRAEFEAEYDLEAELPLADLDFRRGDEAEGERALKLRQVAIYNSRLAERARRKAFILDRGLLNVKRTQSSERRRSPEERELAAALRVFARLHPPPSHDALLDGLAAEARLRARVAELAAWRAAGVTSLAAGEQYDADRRRRASQPQPGGGPSAAPERTKSAGAARRAARDPALSALPSGGGGGRELAMLNAPDKADGPARRQTRPTSLDVRGFPGFEALGAEEAAACAAARTLPVTFLSIKRALLTAAAQKGAGMGRAAARAAYGHIGGVVFDVLEHAGLVLDSG